MASIKSCRALEIGRAPRHCQQNFLVQKREPNLRGAQLGAQVNIGVEEAGTGHSHHQSILSNITTLLLDLAPGSQYISHIYMNCENWPVWSLLPIKQSSHWNGQRSTGQANVVTGGCDLPGTWVWVPRVRTCDGFPCGPFSSSSNWKYLPSPT